MKTPKAVKRLAKIEASLSNVIDRYASIEQGTREALQNAKSAVVHAKETVMSQAETANGTAKKVTRKKPPESVAKAKAAKSAAAS